MNSTIFIKNHPSMFKRKRQFEEAVVEETTTTETTEESTPDSHEQFITILTEMGLSAEQAEAVHQMAMDLVEAGGAQETATTEVQASRDRRAALRRRRQRFARMNRRREFNREPEMRGERRPMRRRELGREDARVKHLFSMMRELRKENAELKAQLGLKPAAQKLSANPARGERQPLIPEGNAVKSRAFEMMQKLLK